MKTNNKKILIVGGSFPMPFGGGSISYVYNLLEGLKEYDCTILTANAEKDNNKDFDKNYYFKVIRSRFFYSVLRYVKYSHIKILFNMIMANIIIIYTVLKLRPKVIYYTEYSYWVIAAMVIKLFLSSKIGIITYAEEITQLRGRKIHNFLFKKIFTISNVIFCVSDYTISLVTAFGDFSRKIVKIVPPVNTELYEDKKVSLNDDTCKNTKILTVARLEERKGHLYVINAIVRLKNVYPDLEYNIVGEGSYECILREKVKYCNADSYIHILGKLSDEELKCMYRDSDIFVMPHVELENGDTEGCPTVFLEASYNKLPVVGGKAGGVSDAIVDGITGFIVNPNSEELYVSLYQLISNQELRNSMGEKGHEYAGQFIKTNQQEILKQATCELLM